MPAASASATASLSAREWWDISCCRRNGRGGAAAFREQALRRGRRLAGQARDIAVANAHRKLRGFGFAAWSVAR